MEVEEFNLQRKPLHSITLPPEGGASMLFLGSTRSGKTTMIKACYDEFFHDHISILHTCSPQAETYNTIKKKMALSPQFCPDIINETMILNQRLKNRYEFLHVIDDCVSSKNDKMMVKLLTIGRNSNLSTMISGQELSILNAIGRSNINYIFMGKLNSSMAMEKCIKQYLNGIFPSNMKMNDKIKLYQRLTLNHQWIVVDTIEGRVFLCKLNL
jgi:hypothetical protein